MSDECTCGRPRATAADLERWHAEVGQMPHSLWTIAPYLTALGRSLAGSSGVPLDAGGGDPRDREPLWARALCWTGPVNACFMRRRWASDRHIHAARTEMLSYAMRLAGATCGHLGDDGTITVGPLTPTCSTATN